MNQEPASTQNTHPAGSRKRETFPIRVLVADDHDLVRSGIVALLRGESDIEVVGEAKDGVEAVQKARELSPHVILMDIRMPIVDGLSATEEISRAGIDTRVLIVSRLEEEEYMQRSAKIGASGYLLKDFLVNELNRAIRVVHKGEAYFPPVR